MGRYGDNLNADMYLNHNNVFSMSLIITKQDHFFNRWRKSVKDMKIHAFYYLFKTSSAKDSIYGKS